MNGLPQRVVRSTLTVFAGIFQPALRLSCTRCGAAACRSLRGPTLIASRRAPQRVRRVVEQRVDERCQMLLHAVEAGALRARRLVHVEPLVDLELQAHAAARRVGVGAHELDALVRIVDLHVVAEAGEHAAHELGERRRRRSCRRGRRGRCRRAPGRHRLRPARRRPRSSNGSRCASCAEALVGLGDAVADCAVVRPVIARDAVADLLDRKLAVVDRAAVVERAPHERLADPGLAARHVLVGPAAAFDQVEVDVAGVAVEVDVGARRERGDQADAALGRGHPELVDEAVLAFAQVELAQHRTEIGGKGEAGMRRVEDQRRRRRDRPVQHVGRSEEGSRHRSRIAPRHGAAARAAR